jgi:hypothetical protein
MQVPLRIFIGSSSEGLEYAQEIQDLLYEDDREESAGGIVVKGWWASGVFRVGETFIESLDRVLRETDAAILVATEDDRATERGQMKTLPRDNITFESGMAIGALGRKRTALAVIGAPKLPTDLSGVAHLQLVHGTGKDFREKNRVRIRELVDQWRVAIQAEDITQVWPNDSRVLSSKTPADQPESADERIGRELVDQITAFDSGLLSNTNFLLKYGVARVAVRELCKEMNSGIAQIGCHRQSVSARLVSVSEYKEFENKRHWRLSGRGTWRVLEADDGTKPISGVNEKEFREIIRTIGTSSETDSGNVLDHGEPPVRSVSWFDAVAYCLAVGGRLPRLEELGELPAHDRRNDCWEWTQSWFDPGPAHVVVFRGRKRRLGVNPDLRLPNVGFRVLNVR